MLKRTVTLLAVAIFVVLLGETQARAEGPLDGRAFSGVIGPVENPDLSDSLYFDEGYFWSDICTRCGFVPGSYSAEETSEGVRFFGTLESDSRGSFDYDGLVTDDGAIQVSITWERRRWYWTSQRQISFIGQESAEGLVASLPEILRIMEEVDPDGNPMCARF